MNTAVKQSGVTFGGFIMVIVILAGVAIFSMKLIPAYMENGKIQKAFDAMVQDPAMQSASVAEIKDSYYKRANTMDGVTAVMYNDIDISTADGKLSLSASYSKKIPLAGNISLLIEFKPSAPK